MELFIHHDVVLKIDFSCCRHCWLAFFSSFHPLFYFNIFLFSFNFFAAASGHAIFLCFVLDSRMFCFYRFESVYIDEDIRVVKDIRGDYLVVDRAPYAWKE